MADVRVTPRKHGRAGFTLMEVLLSVMIMGLIMVSITNLLTSVRRKRDTIHNLQETQLVGPAILDFIERDLRGIVTTGLPRNAWVRVTDRYLLGQDADRIDFVTTSDGMVWSSLDGRLLRADYNEVGFCLRESETAEDFLEMYRREGFAIDEEPFSGGSFTFLHDQVKSFNVEVYAWDGPDAEPLDEWNTDPTDVETQGLPARIDLTLTLELSPRLGAEQLPVALVDRRTVTYRRIVRLPGALTGPRAAPESEQRDSVVADLTPIVRFAVPVLPSTESTDGPDDADPKDGPGEDPALGPDGGPTGRTGDGVPHSGDGDSKTTGGDAKTPGGG